MPGRVVPLTTSARSLGEAAAVFLAQPDLAASTRRSYQQTLGRLERELGVNRQLATVTLDEVTVAVTGAWGGRAPATWNRHVASVRSFLGFCRRRRWLTDDLTVDLERRPEPADRTKAIPLRELEQLSNAASNTTPQRYSCHAQSTAPLEIADSISDEP